MMEDLFLIYAEFDFLIGLTLGLLFSLGVHFLILWDTRDGSEWYSRLYNSGYRFINQRRGDWPGK